MRLAGVADILNGLAQGKKAGAGISENCLTDRQAALDTQAYKLMLEEVAFDEQCLQVYQQKISSYEIRLMHQKDAWVKKRMDRSKAAIQQWWDAKVVSAVELITCGATNFL